MMKGSRQTPSIRHKVRSRASLRAAVAEAHRQGKRVVFTNGCFDLLHVGHVTLLERARRLGDALIVAINSDRSVRALKGPSRPITSERDRAMVLAALSCVDYVTIFDEPTPSQLVAQLKPDVLVKGSDWSAKEIAGRDLVERYGGRVARIKLVDGYSTTRLIARIAQSMGTSSTRGS